MTAGSPRRRRWPLLLGLLVAALIAGALAAGSAGEPMPHFAANRPANIAHGGAQGHAPAGTIEAFEAALDMGADTLEMDLQITADGEVVVHHDGTVDRQTDGSGAIAEMTLAEIQGLDAGFGFTDEQGGHPWRGKGARIPTLEEVFAAFPDSVMIMELKLDGGEAIIEAVVDRVRAHGREDSVVLASFSLDYIKRVRELLPGVPTNMPEAESRDFYVRQLLGADRWWTPPGEFLQVPEFHDGMRVVTPGFVAAAERRGLDVHVWTVNEPEDMHRMLSMGAHGIMTDYPDRLAAVIAERQAAARLPGVERGGLGLTEWLQDRLGWLTPVMTAVTFLGDEDAYVLLFPLLFWAVDQRLGARLGVLLLVSAGLNEILKIAIRTPRPSFIDPSLGLVADSTFGIPSGHAQHGVVVWGLLAAEARRRWAWVAAIALIVVLGFSRLYLGVHFVEDVLIGWAIGLALLAAFLRLHAPVEGWLARRTPKTRVLLAFAASISLILLGVLARLALGFWQPPATWIGIDAAHWPLRLSQIVTPAAALFGLGAGLVLLRERGGFDVGGPLWQRAVRCLVGLVGVVVLWQGLGALFPGGEDAIALLCRYVRYALVGLWIAGLAPLGFVRLGLADRPASRRAAAATGS